MIDELVDWADMSGTMFLALLPEYIKAGELGNSLANNLFLAKDDQVLFSVIREDYLKWLNTKGAEQIKNVTNTTKDIVRREIRNGLVDGLSTNDIADNIAKKTIEIGKGRAKTIALTETHNSFMNARLMNFKAAGFFAKRYITANDEAVRGNKPKDKANHVILNNTVRKLNQKFANGGLFPGDVANLKAKDIVRCRCDYEPLTKEQYDTIPDRLKKAS